MRRFFFHVDGTQFIEDVEGEEFRSVDDATEHARLVAWELARNARPSVLEAIVLVDDFGRELLRISLNAASDPR